MRLKGEKREAAGGAAAFLRRGMREDGGACSEGGAKAGTAPAGAARGEAPGARVDAAKEKAGQKPGR